MSTTEACSDAQLIAAGPAEFEQLFERHHARIHGWLRRRLDAGLAEELAAEVFVRAWAGRAGYDVSYADAAPWLFGIASNLARRQHRQERRALRALARSGVDPLDRAGGESGPADDRVSPGQGSSPEAEVFVQLVDALRDVPLPPRLRATFLRALADVPGLQLTGPTKDTLGRPGLGVAYIERSREDQRHTLVLGSDGALLAVRTSTSTGTLLEDAVIVHQSITSGLPAADAQTSAP